MTPHIGQQVRLVPRLVDSENARVGRVESLELRAGYTLVDVCWHLSYGKKHTHNIGCYLDSDLEAAGPAPEPPASYAVLAHLREHPETTAYNLAAMFGISENWASEQRRRAGIRQRKQRRRTPA